VKKSLTKKAPLGCKISLLKGHGIFLKNNAGRNDSGKITVFRKGGGHKKRYRLITFNRSLRSGIVEFIEHDPYRSANIARVYSEFDNTHFYILAPSGLKQGHYINSQIGRSSLSFKVGNLFHLQDLPLGSLVHNVLVSSRNATIFSKAPSNIETGFGFKFNFFETKGFVRSAGCAAQLVSKDDNFCRLRLPSGEHRLFPWNTNATLGVLSNPLHNRIVLGKAGRFRWLNHRPTVRGVAMNPIDHPHGGGEGKTSGGRPSVSPWGRLTRGQPTRKVRNNLLILKTFSKKK
jgi:large subunit ribosomal protein L2